MSRGFIILLLQITFTLSIYGQSKSRLVSQVLYSARDFNDISGVLLIVREAKGVYSFVPSISPIRERYRISSVFGYRKHPVSHIPKFHTGLDMAAQYATTVHSTASGTVIFAGVTNGYGKKVVVVHRYGFVTCYAHLTYIYAKVGQRVRKGECIGFVGSTGMSTGNHLHYEIIKNKRFINPINFINHE